MSFRNSTRYQKQYSFTRQRYLVIDSRFLSEWGELWRDLRTTLQENFKEIVIVLDPETELSLDQINAFATILEDNPKISNSKQISFILKIKRRMLELKSPISQIEPATPVEGSCCNFFRRRHGSPRNQA